MAIFLVATACTTAVQTIFKRETKMKKLRILLIIFAAGLSVAPVTARNFTLSDEGLMALDWSSGSSAATLIDRTDVPGPGVLLHIYFPDNERPDSVFKIYSYKYSGEGLLAGLDVSKYEAFELKFTIVSIDGVSTPDVGGLISVGSLIGPYDGSPSAYRPAWIDLVSGTTYDSTAISSTSVKTDLTSLLGILVWLFEPSDWNPSGTNLMLLVEAAPEAVAIRFKPGTIYVDTDANGANNGSSWVDAFNDLQDALADNLPGDEIRVAQGIYKPAYSITPPPPPLPPGGNINAQEVTVTATGRGAYFQLINDVVIKGGYAGLGEPDPNARDIKLYETILSGDIAGNDREVIDPRDMLSDPCRAENSLKVIFSGGCDQTAILDGFTITGGHANGMFPAGLGGGMRNSHSSPTVINCTFAKNYAEYGGGICNEWSSPILINCIFVDNNALWKGGGIYNHESSNPALTNCMFIGNSAVVEYGEGGGMSNYRSSPTVTNCTFAGNSAVGEYGAGGGMYNSRSNPTLTNCILWGNAATTGPQIYNKETSLIITYSDVQGGWPGEGNIDAAPCFVDAANGDYHLLPDSPCINTGDPDYIAEPNETDLDGKPRIIGGRIDMGAYEYFNTPPVGDAGPDQIVEAQAPWGATVTLDGSGSGDADSSPGTNDDINDFNWYKIDPCDPNADVFLGSGEILGCNLPLDEHIIVLEVIDKAGAFDSNEVTIIVQDTTPPVFTNIPQDLILECDGNYNVAELNVWLASASAVDMCGSVTITNDFVGILNKCGSTGSATVTWTAEDESGNTATTPAATLTIVDTAPPVIICPSDVTLECPADTSVEANGSATADDTCSSVTITHGDVWQPDCGNTGTLARTWTATDECGNGSSCVQTITVVDTTQPEFAFSVTPTVLWPANHKMVLITPTWTVSDICDDSPEVSLVSISVNEAGDAKGAGNTSDDIQVGDDGSIYLRAERSGTGNNRVYTITYRAVDDCGNAAVRSATVTVPHDQR